MKICITTHCDAINHGAFLQAYALMKYVESFGVEVEFLLRIEKYFAKQLKQLAVKHPKRFGYNLIKLLKFKMFQKRYFKIGKDPGEFGIWGSDVVFQDFICQKKVKNYKQIISYAASSGSRSNPFAHTELKALRKFNALSVRDSATLDILVSSGIDFNEINISVDPIFLYDFKNEIQGVGVPYEPYILAYGYDYSAFDMSKVLHHLDINEKNIINCGYYNRHFGKNLFVETPFELPALVRKASFLITTTFHGVMFALKYNTPFIVLGNEFIENKTVWLLKELGLENRYATNLSSVCVDFSRPINDVNQKTLDTIIALSKDYLSKKISNLGSGT